MRVNIRQKNIEVTAPLREYIEEKIIRSAEKFLQAQSVTDLPIMDIGVERTTMHHRKGDVYKVEANLAVGGRMFHAQAHGDDVRAACDLLEAELEHEMYAHKNKVITVFRRGARAFKRSMRFDPAARFWRKGRIREEGE